MDVDGDKIRTARQRAGMSQQRLAVLAGLGYSTIWALETGRQQGARESTVAKVSAALGLDPCDLMHDESTLAAAIVPATVVS
jgi:transcriptional regulator with XRE-family HTH domain